MVYRNNLSDENKTRERLIRDLARASARIAKMAREISKLTSLIDERQSIDVKRGTPSEAHLRNVLDNMVAMVGVMTPDGTLVELNQAALKSANLQRSDVLFKPFEECYWWSWSPNVQKRLRKAIDQAAAGQASRYDAVIRVGEGAFSTIDFMLSPMLGADGRVEYLIPSAIDITERKRVEEAVRESESHYRAIVEAFDGLIYICSQDYRIEFMNKQMVERTGYDGAGQQCYKVLHDLDSICPWCVNKQVFAGETVRWEVQSPKDNHWYYVVNTPIYHTDGSVSKQAMITDITERKRIEEALRASEAELRALFAAMTDVVFVSNAEGQYLKIVDTSPSLLYKPPNELLGKTLHDVFSKKQADFFLMHLKQALRTQQPVNFEYSLHVGDNELWFNGTASPMSDKKVLMVARDVTERKRTEKDLRESEEKFRTVFEQAAVGMGRVNFSDARWIEVNNTFCRMLGYTREELKSTPWPKITHPEDVDLDLIFFRRMAAGELDSYTVEKRLIHKLGHHVWARLTLSLVRDARGSPHYEIAIIEDITQQKVVQEALQDSEERFRTLANNMSQFAWIADPEGWIYWYNQRWYDYTGTGLEQMHGWGWTQVLHPDHVDRVVEKISRCFLTGTIWEDTFPLRGKDGGYRWFLSRSVPIYDKTGKILRWLGTNTDITRQREAEQALRDLTATLEKQVAERTALLENRSKQLQKLSVELIESEERERRKFANLLHDDLQQMLAAAKMQVQAVAERLPSESLLAGAATLLEESIVKSRQLSHELSPAVLHQSGLTAALNWLAGHMKEQFGLQVEVNANMAEHLASTPVSVFLFRATRELLFNIVKHAGVQKAHVSVSTSYGTVALTVSDQGSGFEPQSIGNSMSGFGLLSIKERASYMSGSLTIESAPGKGSRLTLAVPFKSTSVAPQTNLERLAKPKDLSSPAVPSAISAGKTRVMFVDDHKVMRQGLIRLVTGQPDIEVVGEASNGREALDLARSIRPDVIIMDVSMPEMDGIEATRRIKSENPEIHVIGLSMHSDEQVHRDIRDAGADAFVCKTVSAAELIKVIYGAAGKITR